MDPCKRDEGRGQRVPVAPSLLPRLSAAVIGADIAQVERIIDENNELELNELDSSECFSALHWASCYNEPYLVTRLLDCPLVDPFGKAEENRRRTTPVHAAAQAGAHASLKALLSHPRVLSAPPAHASATNCVNIWNETPLHLAAASGDVLSALLLVQAKASLVHADKWGATASTVAAAHGEDALAQTLTALAEGVVSAEDLLTKLTHAAPSGNPSEQTPLRKPKRVLSKLMEAPLDEERFRAWLEEESIDLMGKDFYGYAAVHKCAAWNRPEALRALLEKLTGLEGVNVQSDVLCASGPGGNTPLLVALEGGALASATLLADMMKPAQLDKVNDAALGAVHLAVATGNVELVRLLIERGTNVLREGPDGLTALHKARMLPEEYANPLVDLLSAAAVHSPPPSGSDWKAYLDAWHIEWTESQSQMTINSADSRGGKLNMSKFDALGKALGGI